MINYDKLLKLLEKKGISQSYMSKRLGMSRGYLRDCIKNKTEIPKDRLESLCLLLGTTPAYLCDKTDEPHPNYLCPAGISDELWEQIRSNARAIAMLDILLNYTPTQLDTLETVVTVLADALKEGRYRG